MKPPASSEPFLPERLDLGIGSVDGYRVFWDDVALVWQRTSAAGDALEETRLQPDEAAWRTFWRALDELDVWSWESYYEPDYPTCGGTQWAVWIERAGRTLKASGRDAWPPGFERYLAAVRALAGERPFG
ncbi:hypothetical protein [Oceanithermus desulfurans]|uniref:Uncharacterized protein n=2 Tax=Oceanithermus desulfurans TaxID=227924 RepID=A0A511RNI3_9DEIN|nr:hypothetical protein [Oceanithermus desulfurans]MBB6030811.1 hypothetical protein [Oceanithermus desulfurans]GEM90657.1 hypothetical protein ODE01S_20910 [Oceanithermus desulfurans NBRC 100063]